MGRSGILVGAAASTSVPQYELRVREHAPADCRYEIWQLPAPATPHLTTAVRVAGLGGRNLQLVEHRVLRHLSGVGIRPGQLSDRATHGFALKEDLALTLGLLFRALAPMRSRDRMRAVAEGIEAMEHEEAAYWLGMANASPTAPAGADGATGAPDGAKPESRIIAEHVGGCRHRLYPRRTAVGRAARTRGVDLSTQGPAGKARFECERRGLRPDSGPLSLDVGSAVFSLTPGSSREARMRRTCLSA